jgi:hypothetical protein
MMKHFSLKVMGMKPKAKEIGFLLQNPMANQQPMGGMFGNPYPFPPSQFFEGNQPFFNTPAPQQQSNPGGNQSQPQNLNLFGMVDQAQKMLTNVQKVKPLLQQLNSIFPFFRTITITHQVNEVVKSKPIKSRFKQREIRLR